MTPDTSTLSLAELRQLHRAVEIAIGAVEAEGRVMPDAVPTLTLADLHTLLWLTVIAIAADPESEACAAPIMTECPSSSLSKLGSILMKTQLRQLALIAALLVGTGTCAAADTVGPGEMPAWPVDCGPLPVLRITERALPVIVPASVALTEAPLINDEPRGHYPSPKPPSPPPVPLGAAASFLAAALAVLGVAMLTRRRRTS